MEQGDEIKKAEDLVGERQTLEQRQCIGNNKCT
jgi:hypothetical protein